MSATHAQLCDLLGVEHYSLRPDWLPYAAQATRIEVLVNGVRRMVFGGSMRCGTCDYGVDIRPGPGTVGINGPSTDADKLACPKCGARGTAPSEETA